MFCWNDGTEKKPFDAPVLDLKPGFTLADSKGAARIRALEESRENLRLDLLQILDKVSCIDHEIEVLKAQKARS